MRKQETWKLHPQEELYLQEELHLQKELHLKEELHLQQHEKAEEDLQSGDEPHSRRRRP